MEFKRVDDMKKYILQLIANGNDPQLFIKKATVMIRHAEVGEEVVTYVKDKETKQLVEETRQTVKDDNCYVVTNPGGEVYVVSKEEIDKRYIKGEKDGEFIAKATPRRLVQIHENISFDAPWGGTMDIQAGGWLNIDDMNGVYGINPEEFNETHLAYTERDINYESLKTEVFKVRLEMCDSAKTDFAEKYIFDNEKLIEQMAQYEKTEQLAKKVNDALLDIGLYHKYHEEYGHYGPDYVYDGSFFLGRKESCSGNLKKQIEFVKESIRIRSNEVKKITDQIDNNNKEIEDLENKKKNLGALAIIKKHRLEKAIEELKNKNTEHQESLNKIKPELDKAEEKYNKHKDLFESYQEELLKPGALGYSNYQRFLKDKVRRYLLADLYNKNKEEFEHSRETVDMMCKDQLTHKNYVSWGVYKSDYELLLLDAEGLKEAREIAKKEGHDFDILSDEDKVDYFLVGADKIKSIEEMKSKNNDRDRD